MLGKIEKIDDNKIIVRLAIDPAKYGNMVSLHVVFEEKNKQVVGEVLSIDKEGDVYFAIIVLVGQFLNDAFVFGISGKPAFNASVRFVTKNEIFKIIGGAESKYTLRLGESPLYGSIPVNVDIDAFFSNHFAIFGNTGSGKSHAVARIFQNLFTTKETVPKNATVLIFDAYGEYESAFNNVIDGINYKVYTTDIRNQVENIKVPIWMLNVDDWALLLGANRAVQLPIIDKALKYVKIFKSNNVDVIEYKNNIIAQVVMDILASGQSPAATRDQIFSILSTYKTDQLSLDTEIAQLGYVRSLKQCFIIDKTGKIREIELITEFFQKFIKKDLTLKLGEEVITFSLEDFRVALEFATISEGKLQSGDVYDYTNILKIRLETIINSDISEFFNVDDYITVDDYVKDLLTTISGTKAQIIDFNINYVDDRMAKVLTKIYSRLFFEYNKEKEDRAGMPVHIVLEEAHRYVQEDADNELLGYNIFERITKEGRKFGVILGLISQRPSELSSTVVSQCSNFLIFKMNHPIDLDYIKRMIPFISASITERLTFLPVGTCVAFGLAFKLPLIIKLKKANPEPNSANAKVAHVWFSEEKLKIGSKITAAPVEGKLDPFANTNTPVQAQDSVVQNDPFGNKNKNDIF